MRKILLLLCIFIISCTNSFAAKVPDDVKDYLNKEIPNIDIRFDGVIILPDNTVYLPLYPSLFSDVKNIKIKQSFPENKNLKDKPDIVIFNNDFVLLKVLTDNNGKKTVLKLNQPPLQVRTGLLPQDMLVPSGLILPENLKGIIGNLKIDTKSEDVIKTTAKESFEEFLSEASSEEKPTLIPLLKNKTLFITTNYSKNIQVLEPGENTPKYSLAQKSIPIDVKAVNNGKFLLVTSYERPFLDVISVADSRFIKQINLTSFPDEILIDYENNKAYVTSPVASTIFVVDLKTMTLIQKIRINGYCENLLLTDNKLFYVDKLKNDIWAIELNNGYTLKNIGKFPNISAMAFINNQLYLASRTKSRIAIVDYETLGLVAEFTTVNKPIAMATYKNNLYILGSQNNIIQQINAETGKTINTTVISEDGFSTGLIKIANTNYTTIMDIKNNNFSIFDLSSGKLLKTYKLSVPLKTVIIADKVKLFD